MNRIFIILIILFFAGCKKSDLITYNEGSGIFFDNRSIFLDTIQVPWGLKNSDVQSQTIRLEVKLFGQVSGNDRVFKIKINEDAPDSILAKVNVDYKPFPLEYKIHAGEASAFIEIELIRNEGLKKGSKNLTIELVESPELQFLYSRKLHSTENGVRLLDIQRVIKMNEKFPIPIWWSIYGTGYFGNWSMKKSILICDMVGIDREKWVGNVLAEEDFNEGILKFAGVYVHRWLKEQDPPILDEDGTRMEMGPKSKR